MAWIVQNLWLIPALPLLAAGIGALPEAYNATPFQISPATMCRP